MDLPNGWGLHNLVWLAELGWWESPLSLWWNEWQWWKLGRAIFEYEPVGHEIAWGGVESRETLFRKTKDNWLRPNNLTTLSTWSRISLCQNGYISLPGQLGDRHQNGQEEGEFPKFFFCSTCILATSSKTSNCRYPGRLLLVNYLELGINNKTAIKTITSSVLMWTGTSGDSGKDLRGCDRY